MKPIYPNRILPECWGNFLLIKTLGFGKSVHASGSGEFARYLNGEKKHEIYRKQRFIAIPDWDKKESQRRFFTRCFELSEPTKFQLVTGRHKEFDFHAVILVPAFEEFIWKSCDLSELDPGRFGFPDLKSFKTACKTIRVLDNDKVKNLLNTLKQKQSPPLLTLQSWITGIFQQ